jgi:enoyl-CoA hydratase
VEFLHLAYEKQASRALITINRPKVLNALNAATLDELSQAVELAAADAEVRVVLVAGAGDKAFVAGADIGEFAGLDEAAGRAFAERGQALFRRIETLGKPVIACIHGYALGGGCELAMACTIRIAAEDARLGQPEVKLGIIAGFGGTQRLPRLVGRGAAMKMLLTGAMVTADEALRIGLLDEVVARDRLMERADEVAREIAKNAPVAVERTMRAVDSGLDHSLEDGLQEEARHFGHCCTTHDKVEGTNAFLEKRAAVWSGK